MSGFRLMGRRLTLGMVTGAAVLASLAVYAEDPNPPTLRSDRGAWPIRRQWTPAETQHYAKWVEHIYKMKTTGDVEQRMAKLDHILTDPEMNLLEQTWFLGQGGNPQLSQGVIRKMHNVMDCAKFAAVMPAYYAYRRALPWMSSYVWAGGADVRSARATQVSGSISNFQSPNVDHFFEHAIYGFSSGNFRVELNCTTAARSDTVPVAIRREYLLPGTVSYLDGHTLLLAKVSEYGELHFLNASMTTTRDIYSYNGMNAVGGLTPRGSDPDNEWAGCFQGLRVWRYPIALTNSSGQVTGVRRRTDEEMKAFGFSTEQYSLLQELISTAAIREGDLKPQSFHDLIRLRMKTVDTIAPLPYMERYADELLEVYELREQFVQGAWRDVLENGPITFPEDRPNENIFQAYGRWETWSSPSSDVDRRNKYFYLGEWMDYVLRCFQMMPEFVDLQGFEQYAIRNLGDLARALVAEKNRLFAERAMYYTKANGEKVRLTLSDIEERLYNLSFDPNHPPELRWGAPIGSAERASAPEMPTPVPGGARVPMEEAYRLQAYYRSLGQRETEMSSFRGMFTEGFPIRSKIDGHIARWYRFEWPTDALVAWADARGYREPPEPDPWSAIEYLSEAGPIRPTDAEAHIPRRPILLPSGY